MPRTPKPAVRKRLTKRPAAKRVASSSAASALKALCRSLPGTTEDIKWEDDLVFSVGAKMYAAFDIEDSDEFGFKCDDIDFERLTRRAEHHEPSAKGERGQARQGDRSRRPDRKAADGGRRSRAQPQPAGARLHGVKGAMKPGIIPAPYAARFGWVKILKRGALSAADAKKLLRKSYDLVLAGLPRRVREQIASR